MSKHALIYLVLLTAIAAHADETVYRIKVSGEAVGYTRYETAQKEGEVVIQTTVTFTLGEEAFRQEIKLTADTHLDADTRLPLAYHLSTYINGYTQSSIDTDFRSGVATQRIIAAGQFFDSEIQLPPSTYIADNNFRVDHYNTVLAKYDFEQRGEQSFHILTPLAVPQLPEAVKLTLTWEGQEAVTVGGKTYETERLKGVAGDTEMAFWYDRAHRRIIKWAIPSQASEALLAEGIETGAGGVREALRKDRNLARITVTEELGDPGALAFLQAQVDLTVSAAEKPPIDLEYQKFDGEITSKSDEITIHGVVTVHAHEPTNSPSDGLSIQPIDTALKTMSAPDIQARAKAIAETSQTVEAAAKAVVDWVRQEIRYTPEPASAEATLSAGAGNAFGKSRLAVAMLRSLGIPARVLGGLLYVGNRQWVSHHWLEAELGDDTAPFDPTLGEFSASHICLWSGEAESVEITGDMQLLDFQSNAIAWQDLIPLQVGEETRYRFTRDGQFIGEGESVVKRVLTYRGVECYEIESTLTTDTLQALDALYLTFDGRPLFYRLDFSKADDVTSLECIREGVWATVKLTVGGSIKEKRLPVPKSVHFVDDNLLWLWDLIFRKQEFSTGMQRDIDVFNPRTETLDRVTIFVERVESIPSAGDCFRVNVNQQVFWVSSVGRLVRYARPEEQLVVEVE